MCFKSWLLSIQNMGPEGLDKKTSEMRPDGIGRQAKVSLSLAYQLVGAGVVPAAPVIL